MKPRNSKLAFIRKAKGYTQAELAEKVNCHKRHIAGIESGEKNPSVELLKKLAEVLEVKVDEIL